VKPSSIVNLSSNTLIYNLTLTTSTFIPLGIPRPECLKFHKSRQRKGRAEGDLECDIVMHCGAKVDARNVFLEAVVGDEVYAIGGGDLNTDDEEAEEDCQSSGECAYGYAGDEADNGATANLSHRPGVQSPPWLDHRRAGGLLVRGGRRAESIHTKRGLQTERVECHERGSKPKP